jgi:FR47-like protein
MEFRPITMEHLDEINSLFPRKGPYGYLFLKHAIEDKINLGVFDKNTNELTCWCFELDTRTLGMIMTKPTYQRSSLAMILYNHISKKVVTERDLDINWFVQHGNTNMYRGVTLKYKMKPFDTITTYHFKKHFNSKFISEMGAFQLYF